MHREIIYYVNIMYDSLWENIRSIRLSEVRAICRDFEIPREI